MVKGEKKKVRLLYIEGREGRKKIAYKWRMTKKTYLRSSFYKLRKNLQIKPTPATFYLFFLKEKKIPIIIFLKKILYLSSYNKITITQTRIIFEIFFLTNELIINYDQLLITFCSLFNYATRKRENQIKRQNVAVSKQHPQLQLRALSVDIGTAEIANTERERERNDRSWKDQAICKRS